MTKEAHRESGILEAKPKIIKYFECKDRVLDHKRAFEQNDPSVRELSSEEYEKRFAASEFKGNYSNEISELCELCNAVKTILSRDINFSMLAFQFMLEGRVKEGSTQLDFDETIFKAVLDCKVEL